MTSHCYEFIQQIHVELLLQRLSFGSLCLGLMLVTGKTAEEVCLLVGLNK